jgi:CoA binding domain
VDESEGILRATVSVLIIDWPSRDVPDALAGAGYSVFVKGGPGPTDYSSCAMVSGKVVTRRIGRPPDSVDLVYVHRPIAELPGVLSLAREMKAKAVWWQSGIAADGARDPKGCWVDHEVSRQARTLVAAAHLKYVDDLYIANAVRELDIQKERPICPSYPEW